jgi:hypothetical protein
VEKRQKGESPLDFVERTVERGARQVLQRGVIVDAYATRGKAARVSCVRAVLGSGVAKGRCYLIMRGIYASLGLGTRGQGNKPLVVIDGDRFAAALRDLCMDSPMLGEAEDGEVRIVGSLWSIARGDLLLAGRYAWKGHGVHHWIPCRGFSSEAEPAGLPVCTGSVRTQPPPPPYSVPPLPVLPPLPAPAPASPPTVEDLIPKLLSAMNREGVWSVIIEGNGPNAASATVVIERRVKPPTDIG